MEEDADEGHAWRLREGQSQGADPEDPNWSDVAKNRFKEFDVDDAGEEGGGGRGKTEWRVVFEDSKAKEREQFVNSVNKDEGWLSLGVGGIVVDSAADESCWPVERGEAFPTKESPRKVLLKIANGGDMQHYGLQEVFFKYSGSESKA